jgi:hypothetical protein
VTAEVAAALTAPVVAGAAVAVLILLAVAAQFVDTLETVAHEGGHMVVAYLTGQRTRQFALEPEGGGFTEYETPRGWGPGRILTTASGYTAPPLLGLAGAALLAAGFAWLLLWAAVVLLIIVWVKAGGELTTLVVLLIAAAVGYVALYGTRTLQAAIAAGLVWLLLFGGVRAAATLPLNNDQSDAAALARDTLIPRVIWKIFFVAVALLSLWGAIRLLAP